MMLSPRLLSLGAVAVILAAMLVYQHSAVNRLREEAARLSAELDEAAAANARFVETCEFLRAQLEAARDQAQACLDRETAALATSARMRAVIEGAQSRDLSDAEKQGVPDDATRRVLLSDLDRPL